MPNGYKNRIKIIDDYTQYKSPIQKAEGGFFIRILLALDFASNNHQMPTACQVTTCGYLDIVACQASLPGRAEFGISG